MKIDNEFSVDVPIDEAWRILTDLETMAGCLPGARVTGSDGGVYTGRVTIKVGPVMTEYAGTARLIVCDPVKRRAVVEATGKDSRGAGMTATVIRAHFTEVDGRTVVTLDTDLTITGKVAQFGSTVIKEVAAKLLGAFVANLEALVSSRG